MLPNPLPPWGPSLFELPWYQGCKILFDESQLDELEKSGEWWAEPKRDGIWVAAFFHEDRVELRSRTGKSKLYPAINSLAIPKMNGCVLVGELAYGSQTSIKRRAERGHDFMDVFDILALPGGDFSITAESEEVRRYELCCALSLIVEAEQRKLFQLVWRAGGDFRRLYDAEPEGLVLKRRDAGPYLGGREKYPWWAKVKKTVTHDFVLMGYELSTAKTKIFDGRPRVEHLVCGAYNHDGDLVEVLKVGALTESLALDIPARWDEYRGRVVEVKGFGQFDSGALRHPSFVRFRSDKSPYECTIR